MGYEDVTRLVFAAVFHHERTAGALGEKVTRTFASYQEADDYGAQTVALLAEIGIPVYACVERRTVANG